MKTKQQEEKRHEIKVGLTILVAIIIIVFAILSIGDQQGILNDRYKLRVQMSRVNGLQTGAPVRLAGVRVGSVVGVEFSNDVEDQKIEVIMEIDKKVQERIRKDSEANIGTLGLLGDKFISVSLGSIDQPVLYDNELLKSSDPIDLEKLMGEGVTVIEDLKKATKEINEISHKINNGNGTLGLLVNDPRLYFDIDKILKIMEILSNKVATGQGTFARLLEDSTLYVDLQSTVKNLDSIVVSLNQGKGSAGKFIKDPKIYNELVQSSERLNTLITKIDKGDGTLGQVINNKDLYNDMVSISTELDSLVKDIRKNPQRYLKVEIF